MDDLIFGPALGGTVSKRPERVSEGKVPSSVGQASRTFRPLADDLVLLVHPNQLTLVPIKDRKVPDFCEICGREADLFWTGQYVSCIDCSKDMRLLRKAGVSLLKKDKSPQEFYVWLSQQKNLMKELFQ